MKLYLKKIIKINCKQSYPKEIRKLIFKRRKYFKYFKDNESYKTSYDFLTQEIDRKIKNFNSEKINQLINKSNSLKDFYSFVKTTSEPQK